MSEPIAFTERYVVGAGMARSMARSFVADRFRRGRRLWIFVGVFYVLMTIVMVNGFDPDLGLGSRVFWAVVYAIVPTTMFVALLVVLTYTTTVRNTRKRLAEGSVVESGFGTDALVVRGPLSEGRISYASITAVTQHGDFVFLRQVGVPLVNCFPRELFPDAAIERIKAAMR
jgi:amino acid transporter